LKKEFIGLGISSILPVWELIASGDGLGGGTLKFGSLGRMFMSVIFGCFEAIAEAIFGLVSAS
jgi:hypothetical protein